MHPCRLQERDLLHRVQGHGARPRTQTRRWGTVARACVWLELSAARCRARGRETAQCGARHSCASCSRGCTQSSTSCTSRACCTVRKQGRRARSGARLASDDGAVVSRATTAPAPHSPPPAPLPVAVPVHGANLAVYYVCQCLDTTAQASAASGSTATWQRAALTRVWISEVAGKQKRRGPFTLRVRSCNVPIPTVSLARARPSADTGGGSPRLVCAQSSEDIYSALQLLLHWRKSLRRRGSRRPAARVRGLPAC